MRRMPNSSTDILIKFNFHKHIKGSHQGEVMKETMLNNLTVTWKEEIKCILQWF